MTTSGSKRPTLSIDDFDAGLQNADRSILARSITLVESTRAADRELANALLERIMPRTGNALRVGISGVPGVGKSTFIEALGLYLTDNGHRVAVLAVDPTSSRTGGSILGDKTRMMNLSRDENAYVRPSPTSGELGGVARTSRESILLCEAAGFDVVLVETVGVGQSEVVVDSMVDCFMVLMLAGAGDELQGIKKGIIEVADLLVVNKADPADEDRSLAATQAAALYQRALDIITPRSDAWLPKALTCSALHSHGIAEVWQTVCDFQQAVTESGEFANRRSTQQHQWLWAQLEDRLLARFRDNNAVKAQLTDMQRAIDNGELSASVAADKLLETYDKYKSDD